MRGFKTIKTANSTSISTSIRSRRCFKQIRFKIGRFRIKFWQLRTLFALKSAELRLWEDISMLCDECGNISISYNSCRNRHCPKCQGRNREDWIQTRETELLPVPYFHVLSILRFLNSRSFIEVLKTALHEPKMLYDILFESAWETLQTFGKNKISKWE